MTKRKSVDMNAPVWFDGTNINEALFDSDLAEIYGYETKNFKRQVKNNIAKFEGDDFMFELNDEEVENLSRCKNFTLNMGRGSNIKYKHL